MVETSDVTEPHYDVTRAAWPVTPGKHGTLQDQSGRVVVEPDLVVLQVGRGRDLLDDDVDDL